MLFTINGRETVVAYETFIINSTSRAGVRSIMIHEPAVVLVVTTLAMFKSDL